MKINIPHVNVQLEQLAVLNVFSIEPSKRKGNTFSVSSELILEILHALILQQMQIFSYSVRHKCRRLLPPPLFLFFLVLKLITMFSSLLLQAQAKSRNLSSLKKHNIYQTTHLLGMKSDFSFHWTSFTSLLDSLNI